MPPSKLIWLAGDLILAGVILTLLWRRLAQQYLAWWALLVLQLARDVTLDFFPYESLLYARIYMASGVLVDVLLVLSVIEWFRLLAGHYPGIKFAGTWFLNIGLGLSFLICLATVGPDWRAIDWAAPQLYIVLLINRVVVGVLGIFTFLIFLAFLAYRVRVRPNVIWYGLLLMCYLWLQNALAIADLWSHLGSVHLTNLFRQIAVPVLYLGWAVLLTRHGEEVEIQARLTEDESFQLDRLNDELLTLARRTMRGI